MRLLELMIHNVRGIRDLTIAPGGENYLVWGGNGTGKSGVVDSIDFLLTGNMGRLRGEGTKELSTKEHGKHIGCDASDAWVKGTIELHDKSRHVIWRSIETPTKPTVTPANADLSAILKGFEKSQHLVLTRKDVLKFIASEAGNRATAVQTILNLTDLGEVRQSLVRASNDSKKAIAPTKTAVESAKSALNLAAGIPEANAGTLLATVNLHRKNLGGDSLDNVTNSNLKIGIAGPQMKPAGGISLNSVLHNVKTLEDTIGELTNYYSGAAELRRTLETLQDDPEALRALHLLALSELGITLLSDSPDCPLCETGFKDGELREKLEKRVAKAKLAKSWQVRIETLAKPLSGTIVTIGQLCASLSEAAKFSGANSAEVLFVSWREKLLVLHSQLSKLAESQIPSNPVELNISIPPNLSAEIEELKTTSEKKFPPQSREQESWDILTRIETSLAHYRTCWQAKRVAEVLYERAEYLKVTFNAIRDEALTKLYLSIRDRFVHLYKRLHGQDEAEFNAEFKSDESALDFLVDFYHRGMFPPNALHSEGHQDSMGVCLYLALAEHIYGDQVALTVLDDVVISVDSDHRRSLCDVLLSEFPSRQFIITTHDRSWAKQLIKSTVVSSSNAIHFTSWNVDAGPTWKFDPADWDLVDNYLREDNVPAASATLRRLSEECLQEVCEYLEVPVKFKISGQHELGDFMLPASERLEGIMKRAKKAVNPSENHALAARVAQADEKRSKNRLGMQIDDWMTNAAVHYNNWMNFTPAEFASVVSLYREFFDQFRCDHCHKALGVISSGRKSIEIACECGALRYPQIIQPVEKLASGTTKIPNLE